MAIINTISKSGVFIIALLITYLAIMAKPVPNAIPSKINAGSTGTPSLPERIFSHTHNNMANAVINKTKFMHPP
jgi:hypothetical protein